MVTPSNSKFKQQAYSDRKPIIGKQSIDKFSFKDFNTFGVHGDSTDGTHLPEKKRVGICFFCNKSYWPKCITALDIVIFVLLQRNAGNK